MLLKALVLDDSGVMRSMLMRALANLRVAEFEFTEAEDGMDGLAKFNNDQFDIVFADWNMPNMNGIEFARKVRADRKSGQIPIVMVTSEKTVGKLDEALTAVKAAAYICKPFTVDVLARKLMPVIASIADNQNKPKGGFFGKLMGG
jgi:two-component system, chemotaxis family, chemotaxis protein CheY